MGQDPGLLQLWSGVHDSTRGRIEGREMTPSEVNADLVRDVARLIVKYGLEELLALVVELRRPEALDDLATAIEKLESRGVSRGRPTRETRARPKGRRDLRAAIGGLRERDPEVAAYLDGA